MGRKWTIWFIFVFKFLGKEVLGFTVQIVGHLNMKVTFFLNNKYYSYFTDKVYGVDTFRNMKGNLM